MDFTNNTYTIKIPELQYCINGKLPAELKINLKQTMEDITDPSKNLTVYKSTTELPYADKGTTYHHFEFSQVNQLTG
jgi:hypothetical protein